MKRTRFTRLEGQLALPKTVTPPKIARRWGSGIDKVYAFIRSGELPAINLSTGTQRPRYLIDVSDLARFEQSRLVVAETPAPVISRIRSEVPKYV